MELLNAALHRMPGARIFPRPALIRAPLIFSTTSVVDGPRVKTSSLKKEE
jgi:hypothetical protein